MKLLKPIVMKKMTIGISLKQRMEKIGMELKDQAFLLVAFLIVIDLRYSERLLYLQDLE